MEWLKKLLGEDRYNQLVSMLEGTDLTLEDLFTVELVAATEVEAVQEQLTAANARITEMTDELGEIKKADPTVIQAKLDTALQDAADWKKRAEDAVRESTEKLAALEYDRAHDAHLSGITFTSELARDAYSEKLREKGLKVEDGRLLGADDFKSLMREANPTAFAREDAGGAGFHDKGGLPDQEASTMKEALAEAMFPSDN